VSSAASAGMRRRYPLSLVVGSSPPGSFTGWAALTTLEQNKGASMPGTASRPLLGGTSQDVGSEGWSGLAARDDLTVAGQRRHSTLAIGSSPDFTHYPTGVIYQQYITNAAACQAPTRGKNKRPGSGIRKAKRNLVSGLCGTLSSRSSSRRSARSSCGSGRADCRSSAGPRRPYRPASACLPS
jgi:hypothetical protein